MKLLDTRGPLKPYRWEEPKNVAEPLHFTDDFTTDRGYFTEEDGEKHHSIQNGILSLKADENGALTYVHVYEKNVTLKLRFSMVSQNEGAQLHFLLRYSSPEAYVSVKYLHTEGVWGLYASQGADFPLYKYAAAYGRDIVPNNSYELEFTVNGSRAEVKLDGKELFSEDNIAHLSPGRIAVMAKNAEIELSYFDAALLSGQGEPMRSVVHNKLPDEAYREGGSVIEMTDGSLTYIYGGGDTFTSDDGGCTWQRSDKPFTSTFGYPNILRLKSGKLLKTVTEKDADGITYKAVHLSDDDGASWYGGGRICKTVYEYSDDGSVGNAINMNDKLSQISTGRIFYVQNFSFGNGKAMRGKHRVLCEVFYSDDGGASWQKSKMGTADICGNENAVYFGECKVLECDDGSLRMYCSWNSYGCIVYSESRDKGVTWGRLETVPELVCARSSMQFFRDPYAQNDTTYYMVWVYDKPLPINDCLGRSRLCLARSKNGKDWEFLGDLWRWESGYIRGMHLCHIVDPFITVTKDNIICGAGITERCEVEGAGDHTFHHAQRQHIYSIKKNDLPSGKPIPPCRGITRS